MKHSTFYIHKGTRQMYTTIKHTGHHAFLRAHHDGKTYEHDENAKVNFVVGLPLDKPIGKNVKEVGQ